MQNHEMWGIMEKNVEKRGVCVRRIWIIALVLALCVGLFGCAMGDGYGKYANIYQLLDAGDYAGAHAAIDALAGIIPTTSAPAQSTTAPAETTVPVETSQPAETTQPTETTAAPTEPAPVDPSKATFVLNTSSMKIHKLTCGSVETIKESNRKYTDLTRDELIAQGYEPCGRCKP